MTGSIANTPPLGPTVPPGYDLTDLASDIASTQSTYTTSLATFNNASSTYNSDKAAIDAYLLSNGITQPSDWNNVDPSKLSYYENTLLPTLSNDASALNSATSDIVTKATAYVDALARRQIYADSTDQEEVTNIALQILSITSTAPTQQIQGMPSFPTMSTSDINALNQALTSISTTTMGTAAAGLLTAFTNLRHNEFEIASANQQLISANTNSNSTYYDYLDPVQGVPYSDVTAAQATVTSAQSNLNTYVGQRSTFQSTLQTAITAYEGAYGNVATPLDNTISSFTDYANSWTSALTTVYAQSRLILTQEAATIQTQDTESQAEYLNTTPSLEFDTSILQQIANLKSNLTTTFSSTPTPPKSTSNMSLSELMRIISQVQLETLHLLQSLQSSDAKINSARLQIAMADYLMATNKLAAMTALSQTITQDDTNYNLQVAADNTARYNSFATTYNAWLNIVQNHTSLINNAIDEANAEITQANQNAATLVNQTNAIEQSDIPDVINQALTSVPQSEQYLDFQGIYTPYPTVTPVSPPTAATAPTIPTLSHLTGSELSPLPDPTSTNFDTLVAQMNSNIVTTFPVLNALKNSIDAQLTAHGITVPQDLSELVLKPTIAVRNGAATVAAFQQSVVSLMAIIQQLILSTTATSDAKAKAKALLEIMEKTLTSLNQTHVEQSIGSEFAVVSANLLASEHAMSRAILLLGSSNVFSKMITNTMELASSIAGLKTASAPIPNTISPGQPSTTVTPSQVLSLNTMTQLALAAQDTASMKQNALTLLQGYPELASLSTDETNNVISGLILTQQNLLLYGAIATGVQAGLTPGQVMQTLFPGTTITGVGTADQFIGMGFSNSAAQTLAGFALDNSSLISLLLNNGVSQSSILGALSLLAASNGLISGTSGVPGGAAFLDTVVSKLNSAGIQISTSIKSPNFKTALGNALSPLVSSSQHSLLHSLIQAPTNPVSAGGAPTFTPQVPSAPLQAGFQAHPSVAAPYTQPPQAPSAPSQSAFQAPLTSGTPGTPTNQAPSEPSQIGASTPPPLSSSEPTFTSAFQNLTSQIQTNFINPPALAPTDRSSNILINPSAIMQKYVDQFQTLPPQAQQAVLNTTTTIISGLTSIQQGALATAVSVGAVSPSDVANLIKLYLLQSMGRLKSLSDIQAQIANQLFIPSDQQREQIHDDLRRAEAKKRRMHTETVTLDSISDETKQQIKQTTTHIQSQTDNDQASARSFMAFAQTVQRLPDFNTVFTDFLNNPAKLFAKQFSLITRSDSGDKKQQIPVILSG